MSGGGTKRGRRAARLDSGQPELPLHHITSRNPDDMGIPGVVVEFTPEEAAAMGAFAEDALSEQDALDSQDIPPEHDPAAPPEEWREVERELANLRDWHRILSGQIVEVNRALARAAVDGRSETEAAAELRGRRDALKSKRAAIEADIDAETKRARREAKKAPETAAEGEGEKGLVRVRHPNRDFFLADLFDYALKDDGVSMEAPIFTLATKPDTSIWQWTSKDGSKSIKVAPSVLGRATQFDKDVLIYVVSQLTEALNRGRDDAMNRTVRFTVYDYLVTTNRGVGGDDYRRLQEAFERLAGTRITTDIRTGGERVKEGFGIIDSWRIVEKSRNDERMIAVEITLSRWLYNAVQAFEVLTIHPDYFRLRKPLARRLYELARKHCGHQTQWVIGLELLQEKAGSKSTLKEFRRAVRAIESDGSLPEYRLSLGADDRVTFYVRDGTRLARGVAKRIN